MSEKVPLVPSIRERSVIIESAITILHNRGLIYYSHDLVDLVIGSTYERVREANLITHLEQVDLEAWDAKRL